MLAEHGAHRVGDLADGRLRLDGADDRRDQVVAAARRRRHARRAPPATAWSRARAHRAHALDLPLLDRGSICSDVASGDGVSLLSVAVDADDHRSPASTALLRAVGGVLDLALDDAALDRRQRAAQRLDPLEHRAAPRSIVVVSCLDRSEPPSGSTVLATPVSKAMICCVRSAMPPLLGRQRQRLVAAVAVQRLRAAQHRRQRLHRDPDDVVVRLLRRQRAAGRLRVEAQLLRARVRGAEPVAHDRAHSRRAARNLATSSRKSLCALKKNDSRWPNG